MDREFVVLFALVAVIAALVLAVVGRGLLLAILPLLVTLNGVAMRTPAGAVRLDQLAGLLIGLGVALRYPLDPRPLAIDRTMRWMGGLLLLSLYSSAFTSPDPRYSLAQLVNYFSAIAIYAVVVLCLETLDDADRMVDRFVTAGIVGGLVGIAAFVLASLGLEIGGANVDVTVRGLAFGSYGTMREPNIYGNFCQIFFVFGVALLQLPSQGARPIGSGRLATLLVVSSLGLVLSFTRGAWIGAFAGLVAVMAINARVFGGRIRLSRIFVPIATAVVVGVVIWNTSSGAREFMEDKLLNLLNPKSENAAIRLLLYGRALTNVQAHPWLGWGTYSFAPLSVSGIDVRLLGNQHDVWLGNYVLLTLHDTGIAGLAIFGAILASVLGPALRLAKAWAAADRVRAVRLAGLVAAFGSLLVSFLASSGFTFGYPWLLLGLVGAYVRLGAPAMTPVAPASTDPAPLAAGPELTR